MNEELSNTIVTGTIKELYPLLVQIKGESPETMEAWKKATYGLKHTFHIAYHMQELTYPEQIDKNLIVLRGTRQGYSIPDYYEEIQEREAICRSALMDHYGEDDSPWKGR